MSEIAMRDQSRSGRLLGGAQATELADGWPVDLDEVITPSDHVELVAVLERSVVAHVS